MGVTAVREFARHRLRRAAYVGVPRAVVEQMMQQEAMRVRLRKRLSLCTQIAIGTGPSSQNPETATLTHSFIM